MSGYEQHPAVREMKRELAVARQTIRSLQDALADPGTKVQGECPCGCGETLFLGAGGYVTCSWIDCPNPSAATDALLASSGSEREQGEYRDPTAIELGLADHAAALSEREQELTNALRAASETMWRVSQYDRMVIEYAAELQACAKELDRLAPAVEEQRCICPDDGATALCPIHGIPDQLAGSAV